MTNAESLDDPRPQTWLDAFPWLFGVSVSREDDWVGETIDSEDSEPRAMRLARVSELAMSRLTHWTIGEILPGLPPDVDLRALDLPSRATTALMREGCRRGIDLANLTLYSMMAWRQVGVGTIDEILKTLAGASTSLATPRVSATPLWIPRAANPPAGSPLPSCYARIVEDLEQIARWYATVAIPSRRLLGEPLPPETPEEIVRARERLENLRAPDVLAEGDLKKDAAELLDEALMTLEPRATEVLASRLFADQARTLDDLGNSFGVTRERVRQIEGKARASMLSRVSHAGLLARVADTARALVGTIRPLDDLIEAMPVLAKGVSSVSQPVWRVLDRLDDAYEIGDGWCVVPTMSAAREMTRTQLQELADAFGVVRLEEIDLIRTGEPSRQDQLTVDWLTHCGYVVSGDYVLTRTGSVADYGAAVLSMAGSPLSAQEIVDRFVVDRAAGSLRNAMSTDERFKRVDRDKWALAEWGMDAYNGIRTVIREQVAQNGGSIRLEALLECVTGRYTVAANSVVSYASAPPFTCADGVVRLASGGAEIRKTPERTRHLYRRSDNWAYRVRVNADHLRGSGSVAPVAVARILGLQYGETRHLDSPIGTQAISWTSVQPSFGSIRRLLVAGDVAADSEGFLLIFDDGKFDFEPVREQSGNPLLDALSLVGAPVAASGDEARESLAAAVLLPNTSPVSSIIGRYRDRGDGTVADFLIRARDLLHNAAAPDPCMEKTDVDAILELL